MVFSSTIFLFGFLPIAFFFYFIVFRKSRKWQNIFLLIISLFFYAWGEPLFVLLLIFSVILSWFCALMIDKYRESKKTAKAWLIVGIVINVSILFVFKYLNFFADNILRLFGKPNTLTKIALPIGISFFTFQALSYVIDVYRDKKLSQKNPLYVGLYVAFFPQLIAGPIVRWETVADQIENRKESFDLFSSGVFKFVFGLGKKVFLANSFAIIADASFGMATPTFSMAWLGAIAYALQIFFDFSGYSDMAIGLGKMFGFKFKENFNRPYLATSVSDFWRRWHISMGSWFRDYVYFPLGGSRVKKPRMIFNLFVVWLLTGLWHGANWTFIIWGLFYFVFLCIEKLTNIEKRKFPKPLRHIYTLFLILIGWVIFRANDLPSLISYLTGMFAGKLDFATTLIYLKENWLVFLIGILCCLPVDLWLDRLIKNEKVKLVFKTIFLAIVFIVSIIYVAKSTYNPFIYFNF